MSYIAMTGMDYVSMVDGSHVRVEKGEEVHDLSPTSLSNELDAGNIQSVEVSGPAVVQSPAPVVVAADAPAAAPAPAAPAEESL
jgi:hypothetical protein